MVVSYRVARHLLDARAIDQVFDRDKYAIDEYGVVWGQPQIPIWQAGGEGIHADAYWPNFVRLKVAAAINGAVTDPGDVDRFACNRHYTIANRELLD
jgi:hypothetical protein